MTSRRRPNIISLTCHDLGRFLHCYGVGTVDTPNIDRLARQGVRFSNCFCAAPQCSPARAALYTGRYPHANGVMGLTHAGFKWDLHRGERHQAAILADAGYHCVQMAVQHETRDPAAVGFHEVPTPWPLEEADEKHRCWAVARQAIDFFEKSAHADKPFYLQVGFFEPHREPTHSTGWPPTEPDQRRGVTVPPYLVDDESARREFAIYQGVVRDVDVAVGRMLDALDRLGLADDTLFMFTSDHGIPFPRAKCSLYDPGLEVPLIVRWPAGGITGGRVEPGMIGHIDVLPTLGELLDLPLPDNLHGRSFAAAWRGENDGNRGREVLFAEMTYHDYYDPVRVIRTERHKLMVHFAFNVSFMDPSQQWIRNTRSIISPHPPQSRHGLVELYDLHKDPLELHDLANDAEHAALRSNLLSRLAQWMRETDDPLMHGVPLAPMHREALDVLGLPQP